MPAVIRPLSVIERLYIMRQNVLHNHNLAFVIKFRWDEFYKMNSLRNIHTSESTKPSLYPNIKNLNTESKRLILQILYPTLQTLLAKLPSLSVSIRDAKSSNPLFLQLDEIYLTSLIKFVPISSGSDLEKLIERQHDLKFSIDDETKPLWRIVVGITNFQKSTERPEYDFCILFCWHHTIVDEISSLSINSIFVETLNEIFTRYKKNTSTSLKKIPDSYTHAILPIQRSLQSCSLIEHTIDVRPTLCNFIKKGISEFLKSFLFREYHYKIVDVNSRNTIHFHNKVKLVSLTKEEVRKLKMRAKKRSTTIDAVIHTAILFSSYHHLLSSSTTTTTTNDESFIPSYGNSIKTLTPIFLGSYTNLQMPWTDMGNYMAESIFKVTFPKPSTSFFPFPPSSPISNIPLKMNKTDNLYFWNLCHKYKYQLDSDVSKFNNRMGLWDVFSRDKILKQLMSCQKKLVSDGKICSILYSNLDQFNSSLYPPDDSVESSSSTAPSINFTPSSPDIDSNDSLVNINLDDPDSNDSNGWKVIDMIFSQSMYLVGPALIVNSIFQGQKMNLCIVYRIGSVDEKSIDLFAEGILNCLRAVCEGGEVELDQEI